ncbi:MAG: hypothetical protein K9M03_04970 [Kiritimatiellales bacterium]|nr:hypothetical protein [Kiritimatiellales bacterium]
MTIQRPETTSIKNASVSCQRVLASSAEGEHIWIGANEAAKLSEDELKAYELAHTIQCHLIVQAPLKHKSGHPGGPLSAFTPSYFVFKRRDPSKDQPYRMSPGHLSLLSYGLQWMFGRDKGDKRLASPQAIIDTFRTPDGLPGHIEAGIGDIPFGTGPLGKGVSNALGVAFGLKYQNKPGMVDVLLADGDAQEGQVMEAFRLASHLKLDNLVVHGDFNDIQLGDQPSQTFWADFAKIAYAAGWNVIEVENGNDPAQVVAAQDKADTLNGSGHPTFICYYTTMGYGIDFMEEASNTGGKNYHGAPLSEEEAADALSKLQTLEEAVKEFEPFRSAEKKKFELGTPTVTDIPLEFDLKKLSSYTRTITKEKGAARKDFGATHIKALMAVDDRIMVLHADLAGSGGFDVCAKDFPNRVINVGVAEANMLMMAAGMRQTGLLVITYTFAAFTTNEARANARLIDINCGHTRCGIINDGTHAGLSVGEDGETHQEQNYFNIPYYYTQVWMPADSNQAAAMAERALEIIAEGHQSVYVFAPRSGHEQIKTPDGDVIYGKDYVFDGKADIVRGAGDTTDKLTIISTGIGVHDAILAADKLKGLDIPIQVRVLNIGCIRPIDSSAIIQAALETGHLIVVEDHNSDGGIATLVADIIADFALPCTLRRLGLNHYFPSAPSNDLKFIAGIDSESIFNACEDEVRAEVCGGEDAFVSAMFELSNNLINSRFRDTSQSFVDKLLNEKGYIKNLRSFWGERTCKPEDMPSSEDLRKKLKSTN